MTQLTPAWAIPYPDLTDTPNGAAQMQAMATKIDTLFSGADGRLTILETRTDKNGGEVRSIANQNAPTGATKMQFGGVTQTPTGITWNGLDTFTTLEDGLYVLYAAASIAFASGQNWAVGIAGTTAPVSPNPWYASPLFAAGQTDSFAYAPIWLTAGSSVCAYLYNNDATTRVIAPGVRPAHFRVWRVS